MSAWETETVTRLAEAHALGYGGAGMELERRAEERDELREENARLREAITEAYGYLMHDEVDAALVWLENSPASPRKEQS
jgi:hypothetical protein